MELIQALHIDADNKITKEIGAVKYDEVPIIEMFYGIEGEGSMVGDPRILLRLGGCRVACVGCDTPHSWGLKSSTILPIKVVLKALDEMIDAHSVKRVAITGGEPMHYPEQLKEIAEHLSDRGVQSWLETSGLLLDWRIFSWFDFVSFDVKTPSSGPACFTSEGVAAFKAFFNQHRGTMFGHVKMIVTGQTDALWIKENFGDWLEKGAPLSMGPGQSVRNPVYITPACGKKSTPDQVRERILLAQSHFEGCNVRIIAQQHAILNMQ